MGKTIEQPIHEVHRIKALLQKTYDGAAWHGPSVKEALQDITAELAFKNFENVHTIAELVSHMTAWRNFAINRIQGNMSYELSEKDNWPEMEAKTDTQWFYIQNRLETSQEKLLEVLEETEEGKLLEAVHNRAYDFYTLLHGVIQHDIYHIGQIVMLKKHLVI